MRRQPSLILIIPPEILLEIFIRVGTKDIGRCRCVSKSWCHILSELDQDFIKGHLIQIKQCIDNELLLFKCHDSNRLFSGTIARQLSGGDFTLVATKLTFDMSPKSQICGPSCDGLILLVEDDQSTKLLVVNPTIKEVLELRVPSHDLDSLTRNTSYGLGYDHVNDDYKVVALYGYFLEHEMEMFANVYSVKEGTWKQVESFPYLYDSSGVFVGGSIHWIATNYWENSPFIAGFDLTEQKIWKVPAPSAINGELYEYDELILLGGCLCMCSSSPIDEINIWVMKEYGVMQSWTKLTIVAEPGSDMIPFIGVPGQRELVVLKDYHTPDERFVVYNLDTAKFQEMTIKGIKGGFSWIEGFRETLVSPYYKHATKRG